MSGNPFRRAQQPPPLVLPASGSRFAPPPEDASPQERRPSKVTKRVRIATPPPLSPDPETPLAAEIDADAIHQVAHESHTGSPPPVLQSDGVSEYNPFDRHFNELAQVESSEVLENTRRNSGSGEANPALPSPETLRGVPENPFARTLATMEPAQAGTQPSEGTTSKKDGAMDVNDFAKMLLTGRGPPLQSASTSTPAAAATAAATASSASHQSTSQNVARDSSSDEDSSSSGAEDDGPGSASKNSTAPAAKQKPAPPKHRHGKSVTERTPQTVSFADFDSLPASSGGGTGAAAAAIGSSGATASPRPSSKALPQLPPTGRKAAATAGESSNRPKPLAAATAAAAAEGTGSASTSTEAASESHQTAGGSKGDYTSQKTAKAPPPPPTRRVGNRSSVYDAHAAPLATPDALSSSSHGEDYMGRPRKAMAEAMQQGQASSSRSSSRSGRVNMPPPPPPRRRGSSKGSVDLHYQSGQDSAKLSRTSQDSIRRVSGQSDVHDATSSRTAVDGLQQKEDVLANLDALQAEVDALRLRYGQSS